MGSCRGWQGVSSWAAILPLPLSLAPVWRLSQPQQLDAETGHVRGTGHNAAVNAFDNVSRVA